MSPMVSTCFVICIELYDAVRPLAMCCWLYPARWHIAGIATFDVESPLSYLHVLAGLDCSKHLRYHPESLYVSGTNLQE